MNKAIELDSFKPAIEAYITGLAMRQKLGALKHVYVQEKKIVPNMVWEHKNKIKQIYAHTMLSDFNSEFLMRLVYYNNRQITESYQDIVSLYFEHLWKYHLRMIESNADMESLSKLERDKPLKLAKDCDVRNNGTWL